MSTDDRSEENRTMDEAQPAPDAEGTQEKDAGPTAEHTPTAEGAPSAGSAATDETLRLDEGVSPTSPPVAPAAPTTQPVAAAAPTFAPAYAPPAPPVTEPTPEPSYARPASPTAYRGGPAVATILLGLLCLAVAGFAFAHQTLDFSVDWARVGPLGVLFGGAILVLLGVLGMRRRRVS